MIKRLLLALLPLTFGLLVFVAAPAGASLLDPCGPTAPTPSVQDGTPQGTFDAGPPPPGNSLYDKGGEGPGFSMYDNGCLGEAGHPMAVVDNTMGNFFYAGAKAMVAVSQGLTRLVSPPTFLSGLDNVVRSGVNAFDHTLWRYLLPISIALLGVVIIGMAFRQHTSHAMWSAGWAVLVIALITFVARYPIYASNLTDNVQTTLLNGISGALSPGAGSATQAAGNLEVDGVLYPFWVSGELGSSTSQTAQKYGHELWLDQMETWGQPVTNAETTAKQQDFTKVASQIKASDPQAYTALTGQGGGRTAAGFEAGIAALITTAFRLVSDVLILASLLIVRLIVILLPAIAVIGLHQRTRMVVQGTLIAGGAAILNAIVFAVCASLNTFIVGTLLSAGSHLDSWVALTLSAIVAFMLWKLAKPFRRLTSMVSASTSPVHAMAAGLREAPGHALSVGSTALGAGKFAMAAMTLKATHDTAQATADIDERTSNAPWPSAPQSIPVPPEDYSRPDHEFVEPEFVSHGPGPTQPNFNSPGLPRQSKTIDVDPVDKTPPGGWPSPPAPESPPEEAEGRFLDVPSTLVDEPTEVEPQPEEWSRPEISPAEELELGEPDTKSEVA